MKLVNAEKPSSFYESFSDLLFSTLILFIVLVMAMSLQMDSATREAKQQADTSLAEQQAAKAEAKKLATESQVAKAEADKARAARTQAEMARTEAQKEAETLKGEAERTRKEADKFKAESDKLKADAERLKKDLLSRVVLPNRFTGGADVSRLYIAPVPDGEKTLVFLPPIQLAEKWNYIRQVGTDPIRDIAALVLKSPDAPDGALLMTEADFVGLAGGVSFELIDKGVVRDGRRGPVLHLMRTALAADAALNTPEKLRDRVGGLRLDSPVWVESINGLRYGEPPDDLKPARDEFNKWIAGGTNDGLHRANEVVGKLLAALANSKGEPAWLKFSVTAERNFRVGKTEMTAADLRNLLRAVRPGKGFYLEYLGPDGKVEEPPEWVMTQVLDPVGYTGRSVDDKALRALRTGG